MLPWHVHLLPLNCIVFYEDNSFVSSGSEQLGTGKRFCCIQLFGGDKCHRTYSLLGDVC